MKLQPNYDGTSSIRKLNDIFTSPKQFSLQVKEAIIDEHMRDIETTASILKSVG